MAASVDLDRKELIELLNKNWMTHDGMWFLHCLQEVGIEKANAINKAAIRSLAFVEVSRLKEALGVEKEKIETFEELKRFVTGAFELCVPDFMNVTFSFPEENMLHWEFKPKECFAYKGIKRIGVIDRYNCGVIYRIECWLKSLGIGYTVNPEITGCLMLINGNCSGDFIVDLQ